ncbi:WG repeat-containing protein [Hymenobacter endophyticus]|uniref:WG repeat-containing protein n=1 Tax=Hymenobacter endophyticus TaxID=3076335 RepID=A0ABU3TEE8_9BACT|nr:WG repeat-containing protein [Hymenobacter endophyticus]MDU0369745.1 WG repeat-containing protein [Hymenobacter endophyticus]
MLHTYLSAPFTSPTRRQQFEAVAAALQTDTAAPFTVLLGNVDVGTPDFLDALILRPRSITLVQLIPQGGLLTMTDLRAGMWYLDGTPLELPNGAINPFGRFERQRVALADWLAQYLPADAANLQFISGLALFGAPVRFGPEVENHMATVPTASQFHLLPDPTQFTRRLARLTTPEIELTEADLEPLLHEVEWLPADGAAAAASTPEQPGASGLLRQKAGQLWRWLGAEDLDHLDRTSSGYEIDLDARNQEKQELENLRTQMQQDLQQQLSALATREAERERRITQLQQQLSAAPVAPEAPDIQAQLAAEKREKDVLESSMHTYRQELETRNQELGQKIQQLENLIERLAAAPVAPPAAATTIPDPAAAAATSTTPPAPPMPAVQPSVPPQPRASLAAPWQPATPPPAAKPTTAGPKGTGTRDQVGRPSSAVAGSFAGWLRWWPVLWRRVSQQLTKLPAFAAGRPRAGVLAGGVAAAVLLMLVLWRCNRSEAPVAFTENGLTGLLAADGDTLLPARYTSIGAFQEERAVVEKEGVFGFVQADGTEVIPPAYDALYPYADGYARARMGGLYTFLTKEGAEFSSYYYAARDFAEGRAAVLDHRGWHYISGPEEPAQPVIFQEAYSFQQELARVKTGGQFTFITPAYLADTTEGTSPFGRYTSATDFDEQGRARVVQNGRTFWLDRNGEEVKE